MRHPLSLAALTDALASVVDAQYDPRQPGKTRYALSDAALAAFSVFFTQSPSFLAYQRDMKKRKGSSNAHTLFGMRQIPTDTHIRNLLDPLEPEALHAPFRHAVRTLADAGVLARFEVAEGKLLLALDGSEHVSSETLHCPNCSTRVSVKGKVRYSHGLVMPLIVSPEQSEVIALEPTFILPQDGEAKQDCELAAAKRWVTKQASAYPLEGAIVLGDDLYCHQPYCELLLAKGMNFILVCKPESHKTLYEYLELYPPQALTLRRWNGRHGELYHYRFASGLPLKDGEDALLVNWCELAITHETTGELLFRNSFATNLAVTAERVADIVAWGRCRWKLENHGFNVLKTKGYHFEHNYGHGQHNLASVLLTLLLYAFLCHTIFALTLPAYGQVRQALGRRDTFFHDIRALTRYHLFSSWEALLAFMMQGLELTPDTS
jgi:hypothetical protein